MTRARGFIRRGLFFRISEDDLLQSQGVYRLGSVRFPVVADIPSTQLTTLKTSSTSSTFPKIRDRFAASSPFVGHNRRTSLCTVGKALPSRSGVLVDAQAEYSCPQCSSSRVSCPGVGGNLQRRFAGGFRPGTTKRTAAAGRRHFANARNHGAKHQSFRSRSATSDESDPGSRTNDGTRTDYLSSANDDAGQYGSCSRTNNHGSRNGNHGPEYQPI